MNKFFKKLLAMVLVFAIVLGGLYLVKPEASQVKANTETEVGDIPRKEQ